MRAACFSPDPVGRDRSRAAVERTANQSDDFSGLRMAVCLQLRVQQLPVEADFKAASIRGGQDELFNLRLKFLEQFCRQTDGARGVVSDRAIDQVDIEGHFRVSPSFAMAVTGQRSTPPVEARCLPVQHTSRK